MNNDIIVPSVLKVVASENLDINTDLLAEQTKTLAELLENNVHEEKETEENGQPPSG